MAGAVQVIHGDFFGLFSKRWDEVMDTKRGRVYKFFGAAKGSEKLLKLTEAVTKVVNHISIQRDASSVTQKNLAYSLDVLSHLRMGHGLFNVPAGGTIPKVMKAFFDSMGLFGALVVDVENRAQGGAVYIQYDGRRGDSKTKKTEYRGFCQILLGFIKEFFGGVLSGATYGVSFAVLKPAGLLKEMSASAARLNRAFGDFMMANHIATLVSLGAEFGLAVDNYFKAYQECKESVKGRAAKDPDLEAYHARYRESVRTFYDKDLPPLFRKFLKISSELVVDVNAHAPMPPPVKLSLNVFIACMDVLELIIDAWNKD